MDAHGNSPVAESDVASKLTVRGVAVGVSIVIQTDTFSSLSSTMNTGWRTSTVATVSERLKMTVQCMNHTTGQIHPSNQLASMNTHALLIFFY